MTFNFYIWNLKILVFWNHSSFTKVSPGQYYLNPFYKNDTPQFWLMISLPRLLLPDFFPCIITEVQLASKSCPSSLASFPQFHNHKLPSTRITEIGSLPASPHCNLLFLNQQKIFLNQNGICHFNNSGCPHPHSGPKVKPRFLGIWMENLQGLPPTITFGFILGHSLP